MLRGAGPKIHLGPVAGNIVIKPGSGIDPAKGSGPGFYGSTRVNPGQPIKPGLFKGKVRLKIRNGEGRQ